jgi:hypothetical protein
MKKVLVIAVSFTRCLLSLSRDGSKSAVNAKRVVAVRQKTLKWSDSCTNGTVMKLRREEQLLLAR